jgi:HEPN domain-containing protein
VRRISRDWLLSAEMDLRSIERMLDEEFLAPVACFHAQQCVEKSLKAILEEKGVRPPKTHDVLRLYGLVSETVGLELDLRTLQVLNDLYVDARYPGELGLLPHGRPSPDDARQFYEFATEVYRKAWELVAGGLPEESPG